jgi:regulator of protease activity HflC (stomatin/prohibitin superfamily)
LEIFVIILSCILVGLGVVFKIWNDYRKHEDEKPFFNPKGTIALICIGIIFFIVGLSFKIIPTGYTGVRDTFGQIDPSTLQSGFAWKVPFAQNIAVVNNKQQDIKFEDDKIWSETKNRTAIYYNNITVTYQINSEKSAWIYANISDYENNLVSKSLVTSGIKSASKTLSDSDATNRSIIEPLVLEYIQKGLNEKYGEDVVKINKVIISNADFDKDYNKAIAAKQKAQLAAEKQAIENNKNIEKAEAEAKVKLTQTKAEAEAAKIKAEAEAEATKIKAEAEAEANKKISDSLTKDVLREKYIKKWNGKLPNMVAGDAATNIMIPESKTE